MSVSAAEWAARVAGQYPEAPVQDGLVYLEGLARSDLGEGKKIDMSRPMGLPRTLGHEIVGTVAALGPVGSVNGANLTAKLMA